MTKEIKFRAWDNYEGKMLQEVDLETMWQSGASGDYQELKANSLTWLQYTGLKDKNGKRIYNGDILKAIAEGDHERESVISDVIQSQDGQWQVRSRGDKQSYSHGLPVNWGGWECLEIIGNIYENGDLLE